MRKYLSLILALIFLIPFVYPIQNCEKIVEPTQDIPCQVVSAWNYTPPCNSHTAEVFNETGNSVMNYTLEDYGSSKLCYFNFNITTKGSYNIMVDNGDSAEIIVRYINMQLALTIGIGFVIALFIFLAFRLDDTHSILKLILIFFSIALLPIIPAIFLIDNYITIFYKVIMGFVIVFWLYVAGFLFYWGYKKLMAVVSKK